MSSDKDKQFRKMMRLLQGLSSDSSNNNESSSNNNVPWYGRVPGISAASGAKSKASGGPGASGVKSKASGGPGASGVESKASGGPGASGVKSKASGGPASGESNANEKITAAFTLYGTSISEIKALSKEDGQRKISSMFKKMALKYHPDRYSKKSNAEKKEAEEEFKKWGNAKTSIEQTMGWTDKFEGAKGGTRRRRRRNRRTRKN